MSLKQLIINAIIKVSEENPLLNHEDPKTAIASRDQFIQLLMDELFPNTEQETTITVPVVPVPAPAPVPVVPAPVEEKKKRAPMTEEAKAAAKAKRAANAEAKKAVPAEVPSVLEPVVEATAAAPAKEKKPRTTKKAATTETSNLAKIDPTWRKHLKAADKDHAKELEPQLLEYVNALTNEAFNAKTAEAHVADFVASRSDGKVLTDLNVVEFNDKEYYVNPETKRVYEGEGVYDEATQQWTNFKPVGYVGMAAFAEMKMD